MFSLPLANLPTFERNNKGIMIFNIISLNIEAFGKLDTKSTLYLVF
jgi:hypothetical protein